MHTILRFVIILAISSVTTNPCLAQRDSTRQRSKIPIPERSQANKLATVTVTVSPRLVRRVKHQFQTIKQALDFAAENKYRAIRIVVHGGTYSDRLTITRRTDIVGRRGQRPILRGSVSNGGGHALTITNIEMRNCQPYALIQRGGSLSLNNVGIYGTKRTARDWYSGIALDIGDGAEGRFSHITLDHNQGTAMLVHGRKTKVRIFNLTVIDNSVHPLAVMRDIDQNSHERLAAVDVADGALLLVDSPVIDRNAFAGITVRDGGRAHLRSGRVTKTIAVNRRGGLNVRVLNHSRLELRNVVVSHASLAGIQVIRSWIKARDVIAENNTIGVHVSGTPQADYNPIDCLTVGRNIFRNNGRDLAAAELPVPGTGRGVRSELKCPGVPWSFN